MAFYDEMLARKAELEELGHEVKVPPSEVPNQHGKLIPVEEFYRLRKTAGDEEQWVWDLKTVAMKNHFDKVVWSDAVLILNETKNDISGYIGANTFLEAGLALHLGKGIYFLYEIPEQDNREELLGMNPVLLNGDLKNL